MLRALLIAGAIVALSGCSTVGYYVQAVRGHLGVMVASRPIDEVVADPATADRVRRRLADIPQLLGFAVDELDLPENGSYRRYADLGRDAMVWSVVAAPLDSLRAKQWCYPIVGCASYRGYFDPAVAQAFAERLTAAGLDSAVEPVPAYSTLGWFRDPLPSTVIDWPRDAIAGLLFHELAHQALYVPGDSAFNEAYATVVEKEGVRRWLAARGDDGALADWAVQERRRDQFLDLLAGTRARLEALYGSGAERARILTKKAAILAALRDDYRQLKAEWGGHAGYDRWFDRPLNNAHLVSVNTYHALEPAFRALLRRVDGDMATFHRRCRALGDLPMEQRHARLAELIEAAEP